MEALKAAIELNEAGRLNTRNPMGGPLRILGLCPHPVENLTATTGFGGVSAHFFGFLAQHHQVVMGTATIKGIAHYINRLRSLVLQPKCWRQYSGKNPWIYQARSRVAHHLVKQVQGEVDLIIQRQGLNSPFWGQPLKPYAIYTDYVTRLGDKYNYSTYRNNVFRNAQESETYYSLEGEAYRRASRVFTYNELVRRALIEDYGVAPEKAVKVGVGVCLEPIDSNLEKQYSSRQIVFIGKDSAFQRKGVPNLLAGFALVRQVIPDAQLLLIGLKPDQLPSQPGVVNLGFVRDRQRLRQILQEAALYAMTPLVDPSPGAIREAMAIKLPVVASNIDGIPEMVDEGETGYLVQPEDPQQLAEVIIALLQDENKMRCMGEKGYSRVKQYFTWERVISQVEPHLYAMMSETVNQQLGPI